MGKWRERGQGAKVTNDRQHLTWLYTMNITLHMLRGQFRAKKQVMQTAVNWKRNNTYYSNDHDRNKNPKLTGEG